LISLQTSEGYGGAGNHGISRMNGGSSSRPMLSLAPLDRPGKDISPRPGSWFRRDLGVLLEARDREHERYAYLGFPNDGGLGLTWLAPWPDGSQLQTKELDLWFIEVCRRIRLRVSDNVLSGWKGTSKATRINAKHLKGALGDPFAPVHKTDNKSFTLAGRDFDYATLTDLILSGDWELPILARPTRQDGESLVLVAQALARGNSKTEGFKSRILPIGGKVSHALTLGPRREALHLLARAQMEDINKFDWAIAGALALLAAGGDRERRRKDHYAYASKARAAVDRAVDEMFFPHLWARFEAQEKGEDALKAEMEAFARALFARAKTVFEASLPAIPCPSIFRPRAEARAWRTFRGALRRSFPELFKTADPEETEHAA